MSSPSILSHSFPSLPLDTRNFPTPPSNWFCPTSTSLVFTILFHRTGIQSFVYLCKLLSTFLLLFITSIQGLVVIEQERRRKEEKLKQEVSLREGSPHRQDYSRPFEKIVPVCVGLCGDLVVVRTNQVLKEDGINASGKITLG